MPAKKPLILTISLLLASGLVLAGQTIIQKGSVITDVFNATNLFVERVSGHQLKGNINALGNKVTNLAEPENKQDAATKAYVDDLVRSFNKIALGTRIDWKETRIPSAWCNPYGCYQLPIFTIGANSQGNVYVVVPEGGSEFTGSDTYLYKITPELEVAKKVKVGVWRGDWKPGYTGFVDQQDRIYIAGPTGTSPTKQYDTSLGLLKEFDNLPPGGPSRKSVFAPAPNSDIYVIPPIFCSQPDWTKTVLCSKNEIRRVDQSDHVLNTSFEGYFYHMAVDIGNNVYALGLSDYTDIFSGYIIKFNKELQELDREPLPVGFRAGKSKVKIIGNDLIIAYEDNFYVFDTSDLSFRFKKTAPNPIDQMMESPGGELVVLTQKGCGRKGTGTASIYCVSPDPFIAYNLANGEIIWQKKGPYYIDLYDAGAYLSDFILPLAGPSHSLILRYVRYNYRSCVIANYIPFQYSPIVFESFYIGN